MRETTSARRSLLVGTALLAAFALWTVLVQFVDVRPVGQNGTDIGFAAFNTWFHGLTGVHMALYTIADWLGLVPVAVCLGFGALGAAQLVRRRSLLRVDPDLLLLGIHYVLVAVAYLVFEMVPINYRPIPIDGVMEASHPSSTTLLVLGVMPTLSYQVARRMKEDPATASLLALTGTSTWIRAVFAACVGATVICGLCELAASRTDGRWGKAALAAGIALSTASVVVFILARQPYAGITCFALLATKAVMLWMCDR